MREEVVRYLTENPDLEGIPLELFAGLPWSQYLQNLARNGTYGDQITLQAISDIFNLKLIIVSTLGPEATVVISSQHSLPTATFTLGHFSENEGTHYVCLSDGQTGQVDNTD